MFADDVTLFVNNLADVQNCLTIPREFSNVSGLCININKSELMPVGISSGVMGLGLRVSSTIKVLGVHFDKSNIKYLSYTQNFLPVLGSIRSVVSKWRSRCL